MQSKCYVNEAIEVGNGDEGSWSRPKTTTAGEEVVEAAAATAESVSIVFEDLPDDGSTTACCVGWCDKLQELAKGWASRNEVRLKMARNVLIAVVYNCFFVAALLHHVSYGKELILSEGVGLLIVITGLAYAYMFYALVVKRFTRWCQQSTLFGKKVLTPSSILLESFLKKPYSSAAINVVVVACFVTFLVVDSINDLKRLQSLLGIVVLIALGALFSTNPRRIRWRIVMWGLSLQFILGLLLLRWRIGRAVFEVLGDKVTKFLNYTISGSSFVYGYLVSQQPFNLNVVNRSSVAYEVMKEINDSKAMGYLFYFQALTVVLFFSFFLSILFHLGVMQWIIWKLGWLLQVTMGTTACESMSVAANIFVGQTEAPIVIQPFLPKLTPSEIHAVMTGGFATIAGSVLAAFLSFGVSASHLLSASVMSAPAALACAKLMMPETQKSLTTSEDVKAETLSQTSSNVLDAASQGALAAVFLVANIAGSLIATLAFVALVNGIISYFGSLFDADYLSLEFILGKILFPLAWVLGVDAEDAEAVGMLIGIKSIVTEFAAYAKMAEIGDSLSERSKMIATYALCGFSNLPSIGIQVAGIGTLAPTRRLVISEVAFRAYVAGSLTCFLTACVAGAIVAS